MIYATNLTRVYGSTTLEVDYGSHSDGTKGSTVNISPHLRMQDHFVHYYPYILYHISALIVARQHRDKQ